MEVALLKNLLGLMEDCKTGISSISPKQSRRLSRERWLIGKLEVLMRDEKLARSACYLFILRVKPQMIRQS